MPTTVLVVEDNVTLRWLFVQQLEKLGLHCDCAENGNEAVEWFKKHHGYELILMDIMMPECDGYDATRIIRAFEHANNMSRTPIVAITCVEDPDMCKAAGMDDFWRKPVLPQQMQEIVEKWLRHKVRN